jgi:hypothetical protein
MNTMGTAAGVASQVWRNKYRLATLDKLLRNALVAEKVCMVDRSALKTLQSPYGSQPTATVQALAGTYTTAAFTLTDDTLTVAEEVVVAEHVLGFENDLANFDIFANRVDEMNNSFATAVDKWVLNCLCEDADTTAYTTPVGGFTTAANINVIMSNLIAKVAGYAEMYQGMYLVIENTDVPGFIQAQATNGFNFADAALNNGFMANYMGVEIYVVRSGTFVDASATSASGTRVWTNLGHRVFGVRGVTTYAAPRGMQTDEKAVTLKTGRELVTYGYIGFKAWASKLALTVDITLA